MTDTLIQMYLMACLVVAVAILLFWGMFRRRIKLSEAESPDTLTHYQRIKRVSKLFWAIFFAFGLMVVVYSALPDFYFVFLPLDIFHHPWINSIGMLTTKLAIVWIIVAQIHIDKELFKYVRNIESLQTMELIWYSEGMLLSGMLMLFIGILITITNVIGLFLTALATIVYFRRRRYKAY